MKRALVVGGVASYVSQTAAAKLARWGFIVDGHVEMGKRPSYSIPQKIEAVIVLFEMVAMARECQEWKKAAARRGLPCLLLSRKESQWQRAFEAQGFEPINPNTAASVAVEHEEEEEPMDQKQKPLAVVTPAQKDFRAALDDLRSTLRELERHGVREVLFVRGDGLTYKREIVEEVSEPL